jgi:hypothetical protein
MKATEAINAIAFATKYPKINKRKKREGNNFFLLPFSQQH